MESLQSRLGTGLIISLVLLFSLQWLIVSISIRYLTENYVVSRLQHDTENLLAALTPGGDGTEPSLVPERIDPIYRRPFSGHYYRITVGHEVLRSRSLWDQDLSVPQGRPGQQERLHIPGPQGQELLLLVTGFRKSDRDITIGVSEDLTAIHSDMRQFQFRYGLISLVVLMILILIQHRIVAAGFAPLQKARRDIVSLEQGKIRMLREDVPTEIKPFIQEINRLLAAMSERLKRSRNALGNLAHALKRPLTLLVHVSDREELRNLPALRRDIIDQTATLRTLVDRELKGARLAGSVPPGTALSLNEEVAHLLEALRRIHPDKQLECDMALPAHNILIGDREDMLELLGNLLDNAFKWAKQRIKLTVDEENGRRITVEDDGPGCPPAALERLSLRGARFDESAAGYGLGLSIVKEIVEQYSGRITFGRSELLGGFLARVELPPYRSSSLADIKSD